MRVFVTGGTGFLGSIVLARLVQEEHEVVALVRDPQRLVVRGVQGVLGSLEEPATWEAHLKGCQACVHMVGILREDPTNRASFDRIHYQGTVDLLRACGRAGLEHFVHISANGVERALRIPYMTSKSKAEQAVRTGAPAWTLLRPSIIYGGRPDLYNFVGVLRENLSRLPAFPYFGDGTYRLAPVCADEVAEAISACLVQPAARGQTYHLCGSEVYTYKALLRMMVDLGGYHCRLFSLPFWMIETAAGLLGNLSWFPLTSAMVRMLREGNTCPPGVSTGRDLGVTPVSLQGWLQQNLTRRPELPPPAAPFVAARASDSSQDVGFEVAHPTQELNSKATRDLGGEAWLTQELGQEPKLTQVLGQEPRLTQVLGQEPKLTQVLGQEPEQVGEQGRQPEQGQESDQAPEQGQEQGQEPEQAPEQGQEREQAPEQGQKPEQAPEQGQKPEQAREQGQEPEQAREQGQEPEQARELAQEPEQAREQAQEPEQAREQAQEPEQARELAQEPEQAREQAQEPEQARELAQEPEQARELATPPGQAKADPGAPNQPVSERVEETPTHRPAPQPGPEGQTQGAKEST